MGPGEFAARARPPFMRAAAALLIAFYAVCVLLSGADRLASDMVRLPTFENWPYGAAAARLNTATSMIATGPASAIPHAKRAVALDPVDSFGLSLLGRAQLLTGQGEAAEATFRVAGKLGWRDPSVQIYWLTRALGTGDYDVSAQRLDAYLRQDPSAPERDRLLAAVGATPEGRTAIAARLRAKPSWTVAFVESSSGLPRELLAARADIMLQAGGGIWDCPTTGRMARGLIGAGLTEQAQQLWRQNCVAHGALVYDGRFTALDTTQQPGAFDWQLSDRGDVDIEAAGSASGQTGVLLRVTSSQTQPVISQTIVLAPGRYRLTWRADPVGATRADALLASLGCGGDLAGAAPGEVTGPSRFQRDFTVDASCTSRRLIFWLRPGGAVRLDDVALRGI